jgi:peptide/nickel transport system ATP-binding protein
MSDNLLDVQDLRVAFGGSEVVHGVDLQVAPGECLALVGASGSGKSATARALLGLAGPTARVTAQRLAVGGRDARGLDDRGWRALRGRAVGLVLQDALTALDPLRTVEAEVAEPLRLHSGPRGRAARRARVLELLTAVGIPDPEARLRQHPHALSGGLRQRVLIASALAADPPLLIADEPTTALDVTVQRQVLELLGRLKADGRGLLLISHDLAVVAQIADRIAVMDAGVIVEERDTEDLIAAPEHAVTRALLAAIPHGRPSTREVVSEADRSPLLSARVVRKAFRDRRAVDGVSLDLAAGETLGVVGESGSGKSTLARIVLGLLEPDAGEVLLRGAAWSALPEKRRRPLRAAIQHVPQDPLSALDPRLTVRAALAEAVGARRLGDRGRDGVLGALLQEVGLGAELLDRRPGQLSGGQRQRVAIARALAPEPAALVCDEPVSALDVRTQAQILALLARLQAERGLAILLISHDLAVVREVCDRVLVLKDGAVVESGDVERVFAAPAHPYTQALLAATPQVQAPAPVAVAG